MTVPSIVNVKYLESHQDNELHAQALQYLNGYKDLFVKIETSGLTPNEIEISKSVLLRRIRISDLTSKELYEAIRAGSEVKL